MQIKQFVLPTWYLQTFLNKKANKYMITAALQKWRTFSKFNEEN